MSHSLDPKTQARLEVLAFKLGKPYCQIKAALANQYHVFIERNRSYNPTLAASLVIQQWQGRVKEMEVLCESIF